jgi:hypothetical protein
VLEGTASTIGDSAMTPVSQQSAARLVRVKTRAETRLKNPQGPNNPLPSPQWLNGPD